MNTWALRLLAEWTCIAACFAVASAWPNAAAWWACAVVIGTRQHAIGIMGHWAAHGLLPHSRAMLWACFVPLALDPAAYKRSHFAHHRAISVVGADHEAAIVRLFPARWRTYRLRDSVLDLVGLRADEAAAVMVTMTSARAICIYLGFVVALWLAIGWAAVLWPLAGITGLMWAHRLRARTEHRHFEQPGETLTTARPSMFVRLAYLPHHTWLHAEHHARPGDVVWRAA